MRDIICILLYIALLVRVCIYVLRGKISGRAKRKGQIYMEKTQDIQLVWWRPLQRADIYAEFG
jgi:hypothetical protein